MNLAYSQTNVTCEVIGLSKKSKEPMLEMFIFESVQLLEQLEQIILSSEQSNFYSSHNINEIFRIMHTIKGSSAMMLYNNISTLAHSMEDLFYYIRERTPSTINFTELTDLILKGEDFIKTELNSIEQDKYKDTNASMLIEEIRGFLKKLKKINDSDECTSDKDEKIVSNDNQRYYISSVNTNQSDKKCFKAIIHFEEDSKMENIRAFTVIQNIKDLVSDINYYPSNILEDDSTEKIIQKNGFEIIFKTECTMDTIREVLTQTVFLKDLKLEEIENDAKEMELEKRQTITLENNPIDSSKETKKKSELHSKSLNQSMISVNISKLDKLMNLVGELVISESMVTQNSDIRGLSLENFNKAAGQLRKITGELQDTVMSIRMVPLSATFHKMNRIIRDMCKKLDKNVHLEIIGEETEVDKNIIEHISDPLMHIVRNAIDHGIELTQERLSKGKDKSGRIILEAKNTGGDVLVIIKDDGQGLNKEKILEKARKNGLINRPENDLTDREIFSYILLPGFSTKDNISEFSGRGVGMDVVTKNVEKIGGVVDVDSIPNKGTTVTIKIPLTLAIMDGMILRVGQSTYTVPLISIKESFKANDNQIITDTDGNEMIMIRGECYPILRLYEFYKVKTKTKIISDGIIMMVENQDKRLCIFADELLGQQQVVVKSLPEYIKNFKKIKGVEGCTLLGDGSISLILDIAELIGHK